MFFRHFAHDFKELISDTERTKLERDLAGEYQRAIGHAKQAQILENFKTSKPEKTDSRKTNKIKPDLIAISEDFSSVKWHGEHSDSRQTNHLSCKSYGQI